MSVKTPSERFLMTLPKPLHDWLSKEAEKLGVSIQDRVRVMLEEQGRLAGVNLSMHGKIGKITKRWDHDELQERCYSMGKPVYDEFATERKRLEINRVSEDGGVLYFYDVDDAKSVVIPVISKSFPPLDYDGKLSMLEICKAARQVAEMENQLLSICEDGDKVFQAMPFKCHIWHQGGTWDGAFRVCLNSEKTPTLADAFKAVS